MKRKALVLIPAAIVIVIGSVVLMRQNQAPVQTPNHPPVAQQPVGPQQQTSHSAGRIPAHYELPPSLSSPASTTPECLRDWISSRAPAGARIFPGRDRIISERQAGQSSRAEVREIVRQRLQELDERMKEMRRYRNELAKALSEWDAAGDIADTSAD